MKSIKTKLVLSFSLLLILVSGALALVSIRTANALITQEAEKTLTLLAQDGAKLTASRIEGDLSVLSTLAYNGEIASMDVARQQTVLERYLDQSGFIGLGVVYPDGTTYYQDGTTAQLGDRDYVLKAAQGQPNVSDIIISRVTNQAVLMFATPIHNASNEVVGVLVGRKAGSALTDVTDDMGFGELGYSYMINGNGNMVAHPDRERVMEQWNPIEAAKEDPELTSLSAFLEQMLEEKTGVGRYQLKDAALYAGFAPIEGSNWIIGITANTGEVLAALPQLESNIAKMASLILLVSIFLCYLLGHSIVRPIIALVGQAKSIARLDITQNIPPSVARRKDEVGTLALAFQSVTENLRNFIGQVAQTSEQVAAAAQELTSTSEHSATAADEIARAMETIAKGAGEQANDTEKGVYKTDELKTMMDHTLQDMKGIQDAVQQLNQLKDDGVEAVGLLTVKTQNSDQAIQAIYQTTLETNRSAEQIGKASKLIKGIAEQTNLLALNAAIEAARAGEAGRGFAVVADEIRKLALDSTGSVQEIDSLLKTLQSNAGQAVTIMDEIMGILKEQVESVATTQEKFDGIASQVDQVRSNAGNASTSMTQMDKKKDELAQIMESLAAIAEENAAGSQEASASVEEQTAALEEISSASESLATLAADMQTMIAKFKY